MSMSMPIAITQLSWKNLRARKSAMKSTADAVDDEPVREPSTAPTTPDGSLTFSPMLQPTQIHDALERATDAPPTRRVVKNVCCVGAGYVGGPSAAMIAYYNPSITVTVVDRDAGRIRRWNSPHLPIYEPGLGDIVRAARDGCKKSPFEARDSAAPRQPNLFFSTNAAECIGNADVVLVAVNTPTKTRGAGAGCATDMTALEGAVRDIAVHARPGTIIVEKSTVPCRTSELIYEILEIHRPGVAFHVLSNPEFLAEGTAIQDLLRPSRVLIGSKTAADDLRAAEALADVYAAWVPRSRIVTINVWSSELAKLVANSMLAQRISSINSVSAICEQTGADVDEVAKAIGLDPRIGPKYLKSTLGFGGSCFQKDILSLVYLAESLGLDEVGAYWRQVVLMNDWQCQRFSTKVIRSLNSTLVGKKLTLLGYAFKRNTGDTRDSLAPAVIAALCAEAPRELAIFDPLCSPDMMAREIRRIVTKTYDGPLFHPDGPIRICRDPYNACADTSAVLILNDCDEFQYTPPAATSADKRPALDADAIIIAPMPQSARAAGPAPVPTSAPSPAPSHDEEYLFDPPATCADDCFECSADAHTDDDAHTHKLDAPLDWARVADGMQRPKWVFDGKGLLAGVDDMQTRLGLRVVRIGKR